MGILGHDHFRWRLWSSLALHCSRNIHVRDSVFLCLRARFDCFCRPYLLVKRAQKLRKETGDDRYWAPLEKKKLSFKQRLEVILLRPFKIFFREPMLIAVTIYMSVSLQNLYAKLRL